jgi:hypothetical protein
LIAQAGAAGCFLSRIFPIYKKEGHGSFAALLIGREAE